MSNVRVSSGAGFTFIPPTDAEMDKAIRKAFFAAKNQVFNDCQKYCKYDQGIMKNTATVHQVEQSIEVRWEQEYAMYAWYTGHPSHAGTYLQWAEHAEDVHGREWADIISKGITVK